ncbi:MAG TPA: hypothetical protein VNN77_16095 [candidate division Zixibacteria bacterium]|nr:hypothetical protein [candidate division Zixibacteria bacterium]
MLRDGSTAEERSSALFEFDPLSPFEFFQTFKRTSYLQPEKRLVLAVLEDAVLCLRKYSGCPSGKGRRLFQETMEWVLTDDPDWLFSFANVCEALGLDPRYVRRGLADSMNAKRSGIATDKKRTARGPVTRKIPLQGGLIKASDGAPAGRRRRRKQADAR